MAEREKGGQMAKTTASRTLLNDDPDVPECGPQSENEDGREKAPPKRRANVLDGKTWTRYSISIWSDLRKTAEETALRHPAMFPNALAARLIESFTGAQDAVILDPFAGVGSTVLAAKRLGKKGIGIELSSKFAEIARRRCSQVTLLDATDGSGVIFRADAQDVLDYVDGESVDLVVTSPPYWDILNEKRSADYKAIRNYGNYRGDLGAIDDYREFLAQLQKVFGRILQTLKPGAYCCVIVMDLRKKDKFYPFHSDLATLMQDIGFLYDDLVIWDRRHEYNNMRPLGYPSVFRINKAHEYILIFQKPKPERAAP
jgi:DNA modification methylase